GEPDGAPRGPGIALRQQRVGAGCGPGSLRTRAQEPGAATMSQSALRWTVCVLAGAATALTSISSLGQEKKQPPKAGRASGVIIKAEPLERGGVRLTINTAAVWRDWARDQAAADPNQPPRRAAEQGAKSVATKGEPQTKENLVVVELKPES